MLATAGEPAIAVATVQFSRTVKRGVRRLTGSLAASSRIRRAGAGLSKLNSMLPARAPRGTDKAARLGRHARPDRG